MYHRLDRLYRLPHDRAEHRRAWAQRRGGGRVKRDEALRHLSREHLEALLAAKKLRAAEDVAAASRAFLDFWREDGQHHFRVEEEVLLPIWATYAELDREAVHRMLDEHLAIRREALDLEAGEATLDRVRELGQLLHDHVRFEERQLFPAIEDALDDASLTRLGAAIEQAEAAAHTPADTEST